MSNASDIGTAEVPASAHSPASDVDIASPFKLFLPLVIVSGAAAAAYTQAPKIAGLFAPAPVTAYHAPQPPIENTPAASIPTPAPAPVEKGPEVAATPKPLPVAPPMKHVARKPVAPAPRVKVIYVNPPPPRPHYDYPAYRSYQPTYTPMPIPMPMPFGGRGGGRMFGGFGGLFGRH